MAEGRSALLSLIGPHLEQEAILQLVQQLPPDMLSLTAEDGRTGLHMALDDGDEELAHYFAVNMESGALRSVDGLGHTALYYSLEKKFNDCSEAILSRGGVGSVTGEQDFPSLMKNAAQSSTGHLLALIMENLACLNIETDGYLEKAARLVVEEDTKSSVQALDALCTFGDMERILSAAVVSAAYHGSARVVHYIAISKQMFRKLPRSVMEETLLSAAENDRRTCLETLLRVLGCDPFVETVARTAITADNVEIVDCLLRRQPELVVSLTSSPLIGVTHDMSRKLAEFGVASQPAAYQY